MEKLSINKIKKEEFENIAKTILEMAEKDQEFRLALDAKNITEERGEEMEAIDQQSMEYLQKVIEEIGWPIISKVGEKASHAAWLLAQHSHDLEFQKKVLKLMQNEPEGEVKKENIAFLQDRVLVNEGKPQVYGTQHKLQYGKWVPSEIEDSEDVDERRKRMGMPLLEENTEALNKGPSTSLK